jgi:hypothetical protein
MTISVLPGPGYVAHVIAEQPWKSNNDVAAEIPAACAFEV